MVNYYKKFEIFKQKYQSNTNLPQKDIPLEIFSKELKCFYGLGDERTIEKWLTNFYDADLIKIIRDRNREVDMLEEDNRKEPVEIKWNINFVEGKTKETK
jgi:hypothetical protein